MKQEHEPRTTVPPAVLILLGSAGAVITIGGLRTISEIVAPTFLALVLTIAAHPLRGWLTRRGVPGLVSTLVVIATVYAVLLGIVLALVVSTARLAALLPRYRDDLAILLEDAVDRLTALGVSESQVRAGSDGLDVDRLIGLVSSASGVLLDGLSGLFFIVTLVLFLGFDAVWFPGRLSSAERDRGSLGRALAGFAQGTRKYLIVSTVFGLIVAVLDIGLLYLLAIPLPLMWGLLAFITNYIPNIGFVIGLVPPALLGLFEHGPAGLLSVTLGYCLLNVVIQSIIQPKFVGDAVGLSASLTFLSLVFWAWVFGPLGALLAIPFSLLARALLIDAGPDARWLIPLLSSTGDQSSARLGVSPAQGEDGRATGGEAGSVTARQQLASQQLLED